MGQSVQAKPEPCSEVEASATGGLVMHLQELSRIGELLRTQDNRITDAPMFVVQQKRREWGYDPGYCDNYKWVNRASDEAETANEDEAEKLDAEECECVGDWYKVYYKDHWEFVTACFTEQGCKDYISRNGHNLREARIYAYGSYRNEEYRVVRKALMDA